MAYGMIYRWTPELDAKLRAAWLTGKSTTEIGRELDITKNAVVGRAHRLGLPRKDPHTGGFA